MLPYALKNGVMLRHVSQVAQIVQFGTGHPNATAQIVWFGTGSFEHAKTEKIALSKKLDFKGFLPVFFFVDAVCHKKEAIK